VIDGISTHRDEPHRHPRAPAQAEHDDLRRAEKGARSSSERPREGDQVIHDAVRAKEPRLSKLLEYDPARRAFFQDSFRRRPRGAREPSRGRLHALAQREARTVSLTLEPHGPRARVGPGFGLRKDIRIADEGVAAGVRYRAQRWRETIEITFTSTSNVGLLAEQDPGDTITIGTRDHRRQPIEVRNAAEVVVHSGSKHFDSRLAIDPPALVSTKPIYRCRTRRTASSASRAARRSAMTWTVEIEPDGHVDLEIRGTAIGQMVGPR